LVSLASGARHLKKMTYTALHQGDAERCHTPPSRSRTGAWLGAAARCAPVLLVGAVLLRTNLAVELSATKKSAAGVPHLMKYTENQRGFVNAAGTEFKASLWFTSGLRTPCFLLAATYRPLSLTIPTPLPIASACDLVEVAYRRPLWLSGSYHPRFTSEEGALKRVDIEEALATAACDATATDGRKVRRSCLQNCECLVCNVLPATLSRY
jgi:hypothetical protein